MNLGGEEERVQGGGRRMYEFIISLFIPSSLCVYAYPQEGPLLRPL